VKGSSSTVGRDERGIWECQVAQRRATKAPRAVKATAAPLKRSIEAPLLTIPAFAAPTRVGAGAEGLEEEWEVPGIFKQELSLLDWTVITPLQPSTSVSSRTEIMT